MTALLLQKAGKYLAACTAYTHSNTDRIHTSVLPIKFVIYTCPTPAKTLSLLYLELLTYKRCFCTMLLYPYQTLLAHLQYCFSYHHQTESYLFLQRGNAFILHFIKVLGLHYKEFYITQNNYLGESCILFKSRYHIFLRISKYKCVILAYVSKFQRPPYCN
jgi:hypothetical protein